MRFLLAIAFVTLLLIPTSGPSSAAPVSGLALMDGPLDLSAAKKKHKGERKAGKKEEYLRAVPSTPPAGTKL